MEVKDLLFFNKEGYAINANYNDELDIWSSKILFDKNSTDTFKTQGLYLFEKINKTKNTFNGELKKFQLFNTNDFNFYPKTTDENFLITKIETENDSPDYNTKWVYAENVEKYFYNQAYCYFTGLGTSFYNNDFNSVHLNTSTSQLEQNVFKILKVESGRILINTPTDNSIPVPVLPNNICTIEPINIIEVKQYNEPSWNESNLNDELYIDKKLSVITGTDNDGIYTIENLCKEQVSEEYRFPSDNSFYNPNIGDILNIELEIKTTNIIVSKGITQFSTPGVNQITLPYIPKFLNIGDTIRAYPENGTILNGMLMVVEDIDYSTNVITVDQTLTQEFVYCKIVLTNNKFLIQQEIIKDNNNVPSLPLTYQMIAETYHDELIDVHGGFDISYDTNTTDLLLTSLYNDRYINIDISYTDINGNHTIIVPNSGLAPYRRDYKVYPIFVKEDLEENINIRKNTNFYERTIVFNTIDTYGLNININGVDYNVPYDSTVPDTINDWITLYQSQLSDIGIVVDNVIPNEITITTDFPNIPVYTRLNLGNSTDYYVKYKTYEFNNIKSQLLIDINNNEYVVPFNTDDDTTVSDWINTYDNILKEYGIIVSNTNNVIDISTKDPEIQLNIKYNIGYLPKPGDLSVIINNEWNVSSGSMITGNEIILNNNDSFLNYYSIGQKISISNATKIPQNKSYNIIDITLNKISLSYQGAFWDDVVTNLSIQSDFFIRRPKSGLSTIGNNSKLVWTWKDTVNPDFFLYDFSGEQLKPDPGFPAYTGPKPLCGIDGSIELKLNRNKNTDIDEISNPLKQQTVFNIIEHELNYLDTSENPLMEPSPLQTFIGYNSKYEGWNKARLYLELFENVSYNKSTLTNNDYLWTFKDNYVELLNATGHNFIHLGFKKNQIIEFNFNDITDDKKLATLNNAGIQYRILEVMPKKIIFTTNVIEETSVKEVPKSTVPYYDNTGQPLTETRYLNVGIKVLPRVIAYFDMFGESEEEDERHNINLNNKNKNILKLQDFFIFKEVDIKEEGIDWVFLNRKRKELLEIYPEIANYIGSYKSIIKAINFFGYNDLTFTEYYQNIDPDSEKFGKLFNLELLNIFDKSVKGWSFSNLNHENLKSLGYKKTNLFSLNYAITDNNGNFIDAYSHDEVKIKLLGLKGWLTNNLLPIGTKILDITGKYVDQNNFTYNHETYYNRNFNVEEYASPVDFTVEGYKLPVSNGSDIYNISVQFESFEPIEWFQYTIKTFYLDKYIDSSTYLTGDVVLYQDKYYKANNYVAIEQYPGLSTLWDEITIDDLQYVQILQDYKTDINANTSFNINKNIDPHFIVETSWHSGYANAFKISKTYSCFPGFFDN